MKAAPGAIVACIVLLGLPGCASPGSNSFVPAAELCNTPGRKALSQAIVERGGKLIESQHGWDNSVDHSTKAAMGPPLANVIMPEDKFSQQEISEAKLVFPEANVVAPPTMADFEAEPARYLGIESTRQAAKWSDFD